MVLKVIGGIIIVGLLAVVLLGNVQCNRSLTPKEVRGLCEESATTYYADYGVTGGIVFDTYVNSCVATALSN